MSFFEEIKIARISGSKKQLDHDVCEEEDGIFIWLFISICLCSSGVQWWGEIGYNSF